MDEVITSLTQDQANQLQQMINAGQYPDAYRYLRDVVNADSNGQSNTASWLDKAASINENDGSAVSDFVRGATQEAGEDNGITITDEQFQQASENLARNVLQWHDQWRDHTSIQ